ncbi:MAG: TAXI family TRAP transporter solute-binding subunit [Alphaproteobacteria bacterium]|nr:TAXI family TRAP transporter solute-binding subunit [Alphaproteobacteria bacterium]OJV15774.1 MAG: hypothetical protein BGO27_07655 [Alphaproteobacteria bacterium 33-17]
MLKKLTFIVIIAAANIAAAASNMYSSYRFTSGDKLGLYYSAADKICYIQDYVSQKNVCDPLESAGSLENLIRVKAGKAEYGIVQLDHLNEELMVNPSTKIRQVIQLYPESYTIVTKRSSHIWSVPDLVGKKVVTNGNKSGAVLVTSKLAESFGVEKDAIKLDTTMPSGKFADNLCSGKIDAGVFFIAHPNAMLHEMSRECEIRIVPIPEKIIKDITERHRYYKKQLIHENIYPGVIIPVFTLGSYAVVVASESQSDKDVSIFIRNIANNIKYIRNTYDALNELDEETMEPEDYNFPVHSGAKKFFSNVRMQGK